MGRPARAFQERRRDGGSAGNGLGHAAKKWNPVFREEARVRFDRIAARSRGSETRLRRLLEARGAPGGAARNEMELKALKTNNSAKRPISRSPMISRTYARLAKPLISRKRNEPCCFCWVSVSSRPQDAGAAKSRRAFQGPRRAPGLFHLRTRLEGWLAGARESKMAPQAVEIAQNGLANGWSADGSLRHASDVVSASACNSPPMRPFSAS
jgi:hypothetical protein